MTRVEGEAAARYVHRQMTGNGDRRHCDRRPPVTQFSLDRSSQQRPAAPQRVRSVVAALWTTGLGPIPVRSAGQETAAPTTGFDVLLTLASEVVIAEPSQARHVIDRYGA